MITGHHPSLFMRIVMHPVQSFAMYLRAWSLGMSHKRMAEYDKDFMDMVKEGNVKFYGSSKELLNDIMGEDVCSDCHKKVQKEDTCSV